MSVFIPLYFLKRDLNPCFKHFPPTMNTPSLLNAGHIKKRRNDFSCVTDVLWKVSLTKLTSTGHRIISWSHLSHQRANNATESRFQQVSSASLTEPRDFWLQLNPCFSNSLRWHGHTSGATHWPPIHCLLTALSKVTNDFLVTDSTAVCKHQGDRPVPVTFSLPNCSLTPSAAADLRRYKTIRLPG